MLPQVLQGGTSDSNDIKSLLLSGLRFYREADRAKDAPEDLALSNSSAAVSALNPLRKPIGGTTQSVTHARSKLSTNTSASPSMHSSRSQSRGRLMSSAMLFLLRGCAALRLA
jgi:hypothetical protein